MFRLVNAMTDGGFPSDLYIAQSTTALDKIADSFPKDSALSFTASLNNKVSHIEIRFGDSYVIGIDKNGVGLYTQEKKRTELAYKIIPSEIGKTYDVFCHFDGEYLRAYLNDPESGLEPWYAFELQTYDLKGEVRVGETTGYGAELSAPVIETKSLATDGKTYQNNVIQNAADPDIIYHDGYYYMYVTGDKYPVYRSADLAKWDYVGASLPEVSWNIDKRYMWAPDVEYIGGKFYMAVSMGEAGFGIAVADKPEGPFVCAGDMPFLTKTIDGHIFVDDDGKIYLYYTSWCDGRAYGIWGLEMESDCLTPKWETEKLIFTPTEDWEKTMNRGGVVEAPYMLKKEGVYYLVYSGSHFEADYAVGYATSTNPLEGFKKSEHNPILRGTADTRGTGHCSIIETHTGGMVMVYHTHNTPTTVQPRHVAIDPVRFVKTADGYRLEVCGPTTSKVPLDIFK
jgi:GH43 family beta-xylosidase